MIRLNVLGASYRHSQSLPWVFEGVELSLTPGIYGLFGPNGSGKTTLLQCIAGIRPFDQGTLQCTLGEQPLSGIRARERLGYVPQQFAFYEEMKARDYLSYVAQMKLIPRQLADDRIAELLHDFGLSECAKQRIVKLSVGQRRRLLIAQAMLNDPHLLLLDEPLAGLDPEERSAVMERLHDQSKHGIVLIASHILTEIEHWVEQAMFIARGRLKGPKTPQQWRWMLLHQGTCNKDDDVIFDQGRLPTLEDVYLGYIKSQLHD